MQILELRAMGSDARLIVDAPEDAIEVRARLASAAAWLAAIERRLSRFRADSELSTLNRVRTAAVGDELWGAIDVALRVAAATDGLVTPTILSALEAAGYERSFERPFDDPRPIGVASVSGFRSIERDPASRTVRLPQGVTLDLGGTAKGACADRIARQLEAAGPTLVDLGGDIAVRGAPSGSEGWVIGIADPSHPGALIMELEVADVGIATSGRDHRRWLRGGEEQHHIIDPRSAAPARTDVVTATVVAENVVEAESAAKVVVLLGSRRGLAWIEARSRLEALVVCDDGRVLRSKGFERHVCS